MTDLRHKQVHLANRLSLQAKELYWHRDNVDEGHGQRDMLRRWYRSKAEGKKNLANKIRMMSLEEFEVYLIEQLMEQL